MGKILSITEYTETGYKAGYKRGLPVRDPPFGQSLQVVLHFVTSHIKSSAIDRNSLKIRDCGFFVLAVRSLPNLFTPQGGRYTTNTSASSLPRYNAFVTLVLPPCNLCIKVTDKHDDNT